MANFRKDEIGILESNLLMKNNELSELVDDELHINNLNDINTEFKVCFNDPNDRTKHYVQKISNSHYATSAKYSSSASNSSSGISSTNFGKNWNNYQPKFGYNKFQKKFPMRSDKRFNVVPQIEIEADENEEINIQKLGIGPDSFYKSNYTKILDKLRRICEYLTILSTERYRIELRMRQLNTNYTLPQSYFEKTQIPKGASDLKSFYLQLAYVVKTEFSLIEIVLRNLQMISNLCGQIEFVCPGTGKTLTEIIIHDFSLAIVNFENLSTLEMFSKPNHQTGENDDYVSISEVIGELSDMVRYTHIYLWSLKQNPTSKKLSSDIRPTPKRDIYIGS